MMRTLFLQAPSFDGFDGGAGSRYQARREIRSYWYPTWLAQVAAVVPGSKLIDAVPHRLALSDVVREAPHYDLVVLHTSTPSFTSDVRVVEALKAANPRLKAGFVGAKVAVEPRGSLESSRAIDFVAGNEFDFTVKEIAEERDWSAIAGLSYRDAAGAIRHNPPRAILENMDELPFVTPVYKRDLKIENYFIGYLKHPYISFYTGRGCKSRCTFCLWPQTVGGHRYRTRSVGNVIEEMRWAKAAFPQVKEFFFDDDTFTDDRPRTEAIARELGRLGVTWSCNAKANVPRETLKVMRDNGLRLLLVGYESGNQQILYNIRKGMRIDGRGTLPRIAMSSASPSTAPLFSGFPARPGRRSRRPSGLPPRSIRTPSRSRSRLPIRAPSSIAMRWSTAGSTRRMPNSSMRAACRSPRCIIRT